MISPIEFHPELVRFAFVLGIVVSIAFYDWNQLTTGGIAVPGYLAFTIFLPLIAPAVLLIALLTWLVVYKLIATRVILPVRARFSLVILVSAALHLAVDLILQNLAVDRPTSPLLRGIGYVVPGLIAHDFSRHGVLRSMANITGTSTVVAAALALVVMLSPELARLYESPVPDAFPVHLDFTPLVVFLSIVAWLGVARYGDWRCGGVLGGGYMTLLVMQPLELLLFWALALLTVMIVRFGIEPLCIVFGRRKLAAHLLVGAGLSWGMLRLRELGFSDDTIAVATPSITVIGLLLTGLLANDIDRVGVARTLFGSVTCIVFTLTLSVLSLELLVYQRPEVVWPLLMSSVVLVVLLFFRAPPRRHANNDKEVS